MDLNTLKSTLNSMKCTGAFSDAFYRFIKEDIGMHYIYPD